MTLEVHPWDLLIESEIGWLTSNIIDWDNYVTEYNLVKFQIYEPQYAIWEEAKQAEAHLIEEAVEVARITMGELAAKEDPPLPYPAT